MLEPITPTAPVAVARPVLHQSWTCLTWLHWPYDPAVVAPLLPPGTAPDLHDGATWVGLIPFRLRRVSVLGSPPLPLVSSFLETNVRLYSVGPDGRRGVVFRSLDAERLAPVLAARASYRLPYRWSSMRLRRVGDEVTATCSRRWPPRPVRSLVRVRIGALRAPSALDHFLTARWGLHVAWRGGTAWAPVEHEPWSLHTAELLELEDELVQAAGLPAPAGEPHVLWSPGVRVAVGAPTRVGRVR
jgi:uncharacterized protein